MTIATGRNLTITGDGGAGGGRYEHVRITGNGSVTGAVECDRLHTIGQSVFHHQMKARRVHVTGEALFRMNLHVQESISLTGTVNVHEDLTFNQLRCGGMIHVRGRVSGEEMLLRGQLSVGSDFSAEKLRASGTVNVGGLLNAGSIELRMYGPCSAAEIGGDRITVRLPRLQMFLQRWFGRRFGPGEPVLTVETIEGDDIELEHTHAGIVRGNRVKIGEGCRIGLVEYRTALDISGQPVIREKRRL
jgi:cytoskeletal protein CcmA (bactofilin family)